MSYAVKQDLIDRFGEKELTRLTDRATPPVGAIDDTVIDQALASAEALANSFIASRMTTPVDPVPLALRDNVCAIARYKLFTTLPPDHVTNAYTDAMAWLKAVASGAAVLGDNVTAPPSATSGAPVVSAPDRIFTRDTLRSF